MTQTTRYALSDSITAKFFYRVLFLGITFLFLFDIQITSCIRGRPGEPVPGDKLLNKIFNKYVLKKSHHSFLDDLMNPSENRLSRRPVDNLDINILDAQNVRRLINIARRQLAEKYQRIRNKDNISEIYRNAQARVGKQYNDTNITRTIGGLRRGGINYAFQEHPIIIEGTFKIMRQSIYNTKKRLMQMKPLRKANAKNFPYLMGILYGSSNFMIKKMESLVGQMHKLPNSTTFFLWYLFLYEKILAVNIDIDYNTEQIFWKFKQFEDKKAADRAGMSTGEEHKPGDEGGGEGGGALSADSGPGEAYTVKEHSSEEEEEQEEDKESDNKNE